MIKDKYIELVNFNWNKSIIEHKEYNNLLKKIHKYYKIDKDMIYVLLDLHLLQNISNINVSYHDGIVTYIIPENPKLNENYENSSVFTFASYALYDKNFKVKTKKRNYILLNSDDKIKTALEFDDLSEDFDIYYKVEFNENLLIPYDINLLTEKEKNDLKTAIMRQEGKISEELTDTNINGVQYFEFLLELCNHKIASDTHLEIKIQCEECDDYYMSLLNEFKEYNKKFFERALLEIQMKNF